MTVDNQCGHVTASRLNTSLVRGSAEALCTPSGASHLTQKMSCPLAFRKLLQLSRKARMNKASQAPAGSRLLHRPCRGARGAQGSGEHKGQSCILLLLPLQVTVRTSLLVYWLRIGLLMQGT